MNSALQGCVMNKFKFRAWFVETKNLMTAMMAGMFVSGTAS